MTNSQKRALTVAAITALSCVGPGCAGTPIKIEERQTKPPSDPCPAGAAETHKRLGILKHAWQAAYFGDSRTLPASNTVAVSEGKVTIRLLRDLGQLKADTPLYGKLLFMNARVVGGFSSARLPDGEVVPICMFLDLESAAPGLPMLPGSTTKKAILDGTTVFVMSMY